MVNSRSVINGGPHAICTRCGAEHYQGPDDNLANAECIDVLRAKLALASGALRSIDMTESYSVSDARAMHTVASMALHELDKTEGWR